MSQRKILPLSNLTLFESETIFSRKIISEGKNELLLWSFVVQWLVKIVSRRPHLKPLCMCNRECS